MADREEEQRPKTDTKVGQILPWKDVLGSLPALVVASGLLLYAYLSICYDRFYGNLGVDPNDVGFGYAGTLARSSGFAIIAVVSSSVLLQYLLMAWRVRRQPKASYRSGRAIIYRTRFPILYRSRFPLLLLGTLVVVAGILAGLAFIVIKAETLRAT